MLGTVNVRQVHDNGSGQAAGAHAMRRVLEWSAPYTFVGGEARNSVRNGANRASGDVVAAGPVLHFWHSVQQCMQCLHDLWARTTLRHHQFDFGCAMLGIRTLPLFQRHHLIWLQPSSIQRTIARTPV